MAPAQDRVGRRGDVEQRDAPARAHARGPARRRTRPRSTRLRSAKPHVTPSTRAVGQRQAEDVGLHPGRAAAVGGEHPEATGRPTAGAVPGGRSSTHRSPVPEARSSTVAPGGSAERPDGPPPPADVEAERHDPVDEVVAGRDGVEHLPHRLRPSPRPGARLSRSHAAGVEPVRSSPAGVCPARRAGCQTAPMIDFSFPPEVEEIRLKVRDFMDDVVRPEWEAIDQGAARRGRSRRSSSCARMAREDWGMWLPHMPPEWGGMGLGPTAMAAVSAEAAKVRHRAVRHQRPGARRGQPAHARCTGATPEQKETYLRPLCEGTARSCFAMTEPEVAGSDPTLIKTYAYRDGDEWVINGHKWFISGARGAKFAILIARTEEDPEIPQAANTRLHRRPAQSDGWNDRARHRDDARLATTTARSSSRTCACPPPTCSAGAGRATCSASTASARPGSPTACAGSARPRSALDMMVDRALDRYSHGSLLAEKQGIQWLIADSAMEIYQCKLMVLHAAYQIEQRDGLHGRGVDGQALRGQQPVAASSTARSRSTARSATRPTRRSPTCSSRPAGPASPTAPTRSTRCASPSARSPPTRTPGPPSGATATCRSDAPGPIVRPALPADGNGASRHCRAERVGAGRSAAEGHAGASGSAGAPQRRPRHCRAERVGASRSAAEDGDEE